MASASLFCLNASSGYLSLAAAAGGTKGSWPRPISAMPAAPFRTRRRRGEKARGLILQKLQLRGLSQGLQEIHDGVDFLLGQDAVASERRHHGLGIALGFVVQDRDEVAPVGIFALDVLEPGPDRARQIAALDLVAGQ